MEGRSEIVTALLLQILMNMFLKNRHRDIPTNGKFEVNISKEIQTHDFKVASQ